MTAEVGTWAPKWERMLKFSAKQRSHFDVGCAQGPAFFCARAFSGLAI